MASRRSRQGLDPSSILDLLDEDDDNASDLELDGAEEASEEEQGVGTVEVVYNAVGEVINIILPRHYSVDTEYRYLPTYLWYHA